MSDVEEINVNEEKGIIRICFVITWQEAIRRGFFYTIGILCAVSVSYTIGSITNYVVELLK